MVAGVTALYMAVIWAYLAIGPTVANEENALAAAALDTMGQIGSLAIVIAAAFSIGANNFNSATTQPRILYGMAQRGMLPRWFMGVSKRYGTPANAILFTGGASIAFGMWEGFAVLAVAGTLIRLVTYTICAAALPMIEHREGRVNPLHAACALLAILVSLFVALQVDSQAVLVFFGLLVLGTVFYFVAGRQDAQTTLPVG